MTSMQAPSPADIRAQLERILASAPFANSKRSQRFLRHVVDCSLADRGDLLKEYAIAIDVFERDSTYDPTVDATVRVEAGRLRSRLREYYADVGPDDPVLIEVPKGAYRAGFSARATDTLPQLQPEPLTQADAPSGAAGSRRWVLPGLIAALAVVLVAATVGSHPLAARLWLRPAQPAISSLAVIPLDNLSGDPSQEYFADGMTDELITMLARESTLRVVSRTSVMQYKGARKPLGEIARALNVEGILEGSVSRIGDHVHLTLQLIRADTDVHLWANSYDRAAHDAVTLSTEAAHEIARRLNRSLPAGPATRYVDPAAHDAYLHGLYMWYTSSNEKAGEYFRKSVAIQPDYALGLAGVAAYYGAGAFEGDLDPRDALPKAEAAAAKAIALDDSLPEAHLTMAAAVYAGRWDWTWSEREIRRAVELNPNFAEGWHLYAKMLGPLNRSDEAIAAQKKASELDPFARPWAMAEILYVARQFDACLAEATLRSEGLPRESSLHWERAQCLLAKGRTEESVRETITALRDSGDFESASAVSRAFATGGFNAVVRWQLASTEKLARKQYVSPVSLAQLHGQLGEREPTLSLLEEGFKQHSPLLLWIQRDSEFDFLHSDPRFRSLAQRIGLPPLNER